ncbi:MAG: hypothetical protein A3E87_02110 [Gammaproteobacteria bacterium RIFCSPHIGHO2_12_FULL_35_23]|nr:MAG: hypothetical protein A3E87_02110 [Gammaproteobacteria bacterium RIFCSPHIGHO2_12_FULL_35_23]
MQDSQYDICIIGGGLVGLSLALALAPLDLQIIIIEAKPPAEKNKNPDESKAIALTYTSELIFKKLSIWPALISYANPIKALYISEYGKFGRCHIKAADLKLPNLGQLVPEAILLNTLTELVGKTKNIAFIRPAKVGRVDFNQRKLQVQIEGSVKVLSFTYRLLIAADGMDSQIRNSLHIKICKKDYKQAALVTRLNVSQDHQHTAYERFSPRGTLALLPIAPRRCALIITGDYNKIQTWQAFNEEAFLANLQQLMGYRLGRFSGLTKRLVFPLTMMVIEEQVKAGVIILGNAAHLLHPIAAQGFNLSLRDIATLTELIAEAKGEHKDFAKEALLQKYNELRVKDQASTICMTNNIVDIFNSESWFLQHSRQWGLLGLEYVPFLKTLFAKQAMGMRGKISKLIHGE